MIALTGVARAAPVSLWATTTETVPAQRKGIAVVGIGESPSDAAWPVALAIYGDAALRPKLSDAAARALAGETDPNAPADAKELAALRAQVKGDDPASRVLLAEIARRASVRAVVLVFPAPDADAIEVRVYDAADDAVSSTRHRREKGSWSPLATVLSAKYAAKPVLPATSPPAPKKEEPKGGTFLSSPWFWGALGAAAAAGVAAYLITRDNGSTDAPPVRIEWGKK
ncbi:MAG: hypothetical protein ACXWUE_12710 [Polyangiales bacterium]